MAARPSLTDHQLLEVMAARDVDGLSASQIGARFGLSRSAICGLWFRVDRDADAEEQRVLQPGEVGFGQGPVMRAENMDGGMPVRWWAVPAQRRGRRA